MFFKVHVCIFNISLAFVRDADIGGGPSEPVRLGPLRRAARRALRVFRGLNMSPLTGTEARQELNNADVDYVPPTQQLPILPAEAEDRRNAVPQLCIARRPDFQESDVKGSHVKQDPEHPQARRHIMDGMTSVCSCCNAKLWKAELASGSRI